MESKTTTTGTQPERKIFSEAWYRFEHGVPTEAEVSNRAKELMSHAQRQELVLKRCTTERRCGLRSCPICRRNAQMAFIKKITPELARRSESEGQELFFITILPEYGKMAWGELPTPTMKRFVDKIRATLGRDRLEAFGAFGVDVSSEPGLTGRYAQWHIHGVIGGLSKDEKRALRKVFRWKNNPDGVKAVRFDTITDLRGAVAYSAKCNFFRRDLSPEKIGTMTKRQLTIREEAKMLDGLSRYKATSFHFTLKM